MNRSLRTTLSLLTLALVASACSTTTTLLETKKVDYKSAGKRTVQPLEIPPDLTQPTRDDRYAVPDVAPRGTATYSAYQADRVEGQPTPSGVGEVLPDDPRMHIERSGSQRWLVVPGRPEDLWPQVKDFWTELGFILNLDSPEVGVMETDWAENRAAIPKDFIRSALGWVVDGLYSTPERDKFRTRLEEDSEQGMVEIFISHRGMIEIYPTEARDSTIWQPRPADPELEAEMLRRLMVYLGANEERARAELSVASAPDRARVIAETSLQLDESFDRAWRRVGLALDRVGFTVEDRDRSAGVYFVRYVDPQEDNRASSKKGFLSKLMFWRGDQPVAQGGSEYQLAVRAQGNLSRVSVLTKDGNLDVSPTAKRIINLLYQQLR